MQISNWYFLCPSLCVVKSYNEGPGNGATVMNNVLVLAEASRGWRLGSEICVQCACILLIMITP